MPELRQVGWMSTEGKFDLERLWTMRIKSSTEGMVPVYVVEEEDGTESDSK